MKERFTIPLFFLIALPLLNTCSNEKPFNVSYPRVITDQKIVVTSVGVKFKGSVLAYGSQPIVDHGFEWRQITLSTYVNNVSLGKFIKNTFEVEIVRGFETSNVYEVRAFVKTAKLISYGDWIEFSGAGSLPPVVVDFSPKFGTWGDTITIKGSNFSFSPSISFAKFDDVNASVLSTSDTLVKVVVPAEFISLSKTKIKITVGTRIILTNDFFKLNEPIISDVSPTKGGSQTEVLVAGKYFNTKNLSIVFGGINVSPSEKSNSGFKFKVPKEVKAGETDLSFMSGPFTVMAQKIFYRNSPILSEMTPRDGFYGDVVTLVGEGFGSQFNDNKIETEGAELVIVEKNINTLKVIVPKLAKSLLKFSITADFVKTQSDLTFAINPPEITSVYPKDAVFPGQSIVIKGNRFYSQPSGYLEYYPYDILMNDLVAAKVITAETDLLRVEMPLVSSYSSTLSISLLGKKLTESTEAINTPIVKAMTLPGYNRSQTASFSIGNTGYIIGGAINNEEILDNQVLTFDAIAKSFSVVRDFPGKPRKQAIGFASGGRGYLLGGKDQNNLNLFELWEYDPTNDQWSKKMNCPFLPYKIFNVASGVYCASDVDLYQYFPSTDTWMKKKQLPFSLSNNPYHFTMQVNEKIYISSENNFTYQLFQYDDQNDLWLSRGSMNFNNREVNFSFEYGGLGIIMVNSNAFYKYNPVNSQWDLLADKVGKIYMDDNSTVKLRINDKWYFGLWRYNSYIVDEGLRNILYEFDGAKAGL